MFQLPPEWSNYILRDPAGNSVRSNSNTNQLDFSGIASGRYSLRRLPGQTAQRHDLVIDPKIPGGLLSTRPLGNGLTEFRFGETGGQGVYFVSIQSPAGAVQRSFYAYAQTIPIQIEPGDWRVVISPPGETGFSVNVEVNSSGQLETLNDIALVDKSDWFLDVLSEGTKISSYSLDSGLAQFAFVDAVNPVHIIQLRDLATGTVSTWFTKEEIFEVVVDSGQFEWRVLGIPQETAIYPDLLNGLSSTDIGWTSFIQRRPVAEPELGLRVPQNWANFQITDPGGRTVLADSGDIWADFSQLVDGRYSFRGTTDGVAVREELVLSRNASLNIVSVRDLSETDGKVRLRFGKPSDSGPFFVTVKDGSGQYLSGAYYYATTVDLLLGDGEFSVNIAKPGEAGTTTTIVQSQGDLEQVNGIGLNAPDDWYLDLVQRADPIGPISFNSGPAGFSFDGVGDTFIVQLRDPATTNVGTYFAAEKQLEILLGLGGFEWRVFSVPEQALADPDVISRISSIEGGWTPFTQLSEPLPVDYILGQEPDRIVSADQLILNYPTDAVKLDDGSVVITNTFASSVLRIFPDGHIENLAGAFRDGYTASGVGSEVLLRGPGQILDNGDGTLLFADSRNLVIRKIDLQSGLVTTLYGARDLFTPTIVDGQLAAVGDVYDIGRDDRDNLFITAAETFSDGDKLYNSTETRVLRENDQGEWYKWLFDDSSFSANNYKIVDMLFHDGIVSTLIHDGATKRYVQFYPDGAVKANIEIGTAFGGGLILDPTTGDVIIGNHTAIFRIDPASLAITELRFPEPLANVSFMNRNGNIITVVDSDRGRVYEYDLQSENIIAAFGQQSSVSNVVVDLENANGTLLALDNQTPRILKYENGGFSILAGNGKQGAATAGVQAVDTSLLFPNAIASAPDGSIYVVDSNHRIMKIDTNGEIGVFAGSVASGYSGDGGAATAARFQTIYGLEVSQSGDVYVADSFNHAIRKISANGTISTVAGNGVAGLGSTAVGNVASLNTPQRVLTTASGRVFISDSWNNRVVELTPDGNLLAVAGVGNFTTYQGSGGFAGDGGSATEADLNTPVGLAYYESDGTLFIADNFNHRVRYVDSAGDIHTLVGGVKGYARGTLLNLPTDVELVGDTLYVSDTGNGLVMEINNVDRTGNDLANSLDVAKAISRNNLTSRREHVGPDDLDFYDIRSVTSHKIVVTAVSNGLQLSFSEGTNDYNGTQTLSAGQSYEINPGSHQFFLIGADQEQNYTLNFTDLASSSRSAGRRVAQASSLLASSADAGTLAQTTSDNKPLLGSASRYDRRLDLMRQEMNVFGVGDGMTDSRFDTARTFPHLDVFFA